MKKYLFIVLLTLLSPTLRAQDNTWEQPEEDEMEKTEKVNPNAKYLQGAVPEVDGKVVFQKTISTPGKTADEIYAIVKRYMTRMTHEKNQVQSQIVLVLAVPVVLRLALRRKIMPKRQQRRKNV